MPKLYKTYKIKSKRARKNTQKNKKLLRFDASKIHPASIQLRPT